MDTNLDLLRLAQTPYLGWYISGEAETPTKFRVHAREDQGNSVFRIDVDGRHVPDSEWHGKYVAAKDLGVWLAKGKIFLATWKDREEYSVNAPLPRHNVPTQRIRDAILVNLFRLHEAGFPHETQIDLDGVAAEFAVEPLLVHRAVEYLYDHQYIEDFGSFGRNWSTGDFWISSSGIQHLEGRKLIPNLVESTSGETVLEAQPMTDPVTGVGDRKRVAVVHGRDIQLRDDMFDFLGAIGLRPVEWSQAITATGKGTPYNKEAVAEIFRNTQAVVVLMTGDDEARLDARLRTESDASFESVLTPQPRPNVLIELGMAFGIMDSRTIIVQIGNLRPISDLAGLNVARLSNDASSRKQLAGRLRNAGCDVDDSGDRWLKVGDFERNVRLPTPSSVRLDTDSQDEIQLIIGRLKSETVEIYGPITVAEFLRRCGGELSAGYEDRRPSVLIQALGLQQVSGQDFPFAGIRNALNSLLAEGLVERQTKNTSEFHALGTDYYAYKLIQPLGRDVLRVLRTSRE